MTDGPPGRLARAKTAGAARWRAVKSRRPSVRHSVAAWHRLQDNNGNQYAGAITYFSFLALFPLLLLAVSVTGFVLHSHPHAMQQLFDHITAQLPGEFGTTVKTSISTAIKARTGVGIVGLAGVLLTGLGWIGNLRAAVAAVWGRKPTQHNFLVAKLANLLVLAGLGLGIVVSIALTTGGTAASDELLRVLSLDGRPGTQTLVTVVGLLLAVLGDMVIFSWLLVRLPGVDVPGRVALKGAVLVSVGFEVLKIVGAYTIKRSAASPTAGPFASVVAVLVWIQLVARWMLFCAAWMSVLTDESARTPARPEPPVCAEPAPAGAPDSVPAGPRAGTVGASVFAAGAAVGAAVVAWAFTRTAGRRGRRRLSGRPRRRRGGTRP
jgi:membrane protein